jgi:hypothetical protein
MKLHMRQPVSSKPKTRGYLTTVKGQYDMRYMMLIYSQELEGTSPEQLGEVAAAHRTLMDEAQRKGVFCAADPLEFSTTATTVWVQNGEALITDGPFAETKEQLAGYYILDCENLDVALEWAARIPTGCQGGMGFVEVRPIRKMPRSAPTHGRL